jgi:MFS family permease
MGVTIGLIVVFVGTIIQVVPAVDQGMFIAGRFLVGLGQRSYPPCARQSMLTVFSRSNVSQGSAPLLITELAYPQHRGKVTTMYNTLWYVGSIIAAWNVFGTIKYTTDAA